VTTKKRNKLRAILIIFLLIIIPLGNRFVFAQGSIRSAKKILVLLSLEANRPIQVLFSSTFRQEMNRRSSHPYEVNYENLDLARFRDKTYKDNLKEIIDQKYSVHQPDIIIIFLLHAAGFVAEYNLFPGIPKIYITPQLTTKRKAQLANNSVFGSFGFDFRGNIKHSLELFPDTRKMVVISGNGISDKGFENTFKRGSKEFMSQVAFEYIRGLEVEKLLSRVENLPDRSLIYYLTYSEDTLGRRINAVKFAEQLGQRANRPVFGFMDLLVINTGILGGRITSVESISNWAAEVVWRVFKGEDTNSIEDPDFGYKYLYNWPKLKKWGLNEKRLPPNSVIYDKKYTFFELYKWQIFGGVLLFVFESLLILILFVNINRRKKAENTLRLSHETLEQSEERWRSLTETSPDHILMLDTSLKIQFVNFAASGLTVEELIGTPLYQYVEGDEKKAAVKTILENVVQTGEQKSYETVYSVPQGGEIIFESRVVPRRSRGSNEIIGLTVSSRNITERKQAEEALSESEEKYRNVVQNAIETICVIQDGMFKYFNPEAVRLYGYTEEELEQLPANKTVYPEDKEGVISRRLKRERGEQLSDTYSHRIITKDGLIRWVEIRAVTITWNSSPAVLVFLTDITERKQSEELMIQTEKMMSVGGLAAGMAHELNNPLGGMLQGIQNVQRRLSPDLKANLKYAKEFGIDLHDLQSYMDQRGVLSFIKGIIESGKKASEIISNMLQFSRKSESFMAPNNLTELIDNVLELAGKDYDLKKRYDFRKIEIIKEFDSNLPLVPCTETEIEQVILNLINNSAWAVANEKSDDPPQIRLRVNVENQMARIEIEDNGPGMDEATRKKIFEPFFTTKPVGEGTGLGLSVSYMIITNNHQGTMEVVSELGKGTKFIIQLPLERELTS
jgi:PAS domain S-box-containing protein